MEWPKVWESLVASGPLAMVLGAACVLLWRAWQAERDGRAKDEERCRQELKAAQDARIGDLQSMLRPRT